MNTRFIIGLAVFAIAAVLGWYLTGRTDVDIPFLPKAPITEKVTEQAQDVLNRATQTPAPAAEGGEKGGVSERTVITYTDQGFAPSDITVTEGTVVAFMNESTKYMKLSGENGLIEQSVRVSPGGSFEYQFIDAGTYTYANTEVPAHTGTVRVTQ